MSYYRRSQTPGAAYFFTVNTYRRQRILTHPDVMDALRTALCDVRLQDPFKIDAMVVLPDHLHAIWTLPPGDAHFAIRWSIIKRKVSQAARHLVDQTHSASRERRREIDFWQRRYWEHQIRDDADFGRHVDYVHYNPVKHGHVDRVRDWPYSTFHRYVRLGVCPPIGPVVELMRRVVILGSERVRIAHPTWLPFSPRTRGHKRRAHPWL